MQIHSRTLTLATVVLAQLVDRLGLYVQVLSFLNRKQSCTVIAGVHV